MLIDTDILSYYLKGNTDVVQALDKYEKENAPVFISRITVVEILGGLRAKNAPAQETHFVSFLNDRNVLDTN